MRGYISGVNKKLLRMMRVVEGYPQEIDNRNGWENEQIELDHKLFAILTSFVDGDALDIMEAAEEGYGLECWRQFAKDNEPKGPGFNRTKLMQIIDPQIVGNRSFSVKVKKWKKLYKDYTRKGGEAIPENIRVGVLQAKLAPDKVKDHLLLNAGKFETFKAMEDEIERYLVETEGMNSEAMDISYMGG
jgi:hypothetical protein